MCEGGHHEEGQKQSSHSGGMVQDIQNEGKRNINSILSTIIIVVEMLADRTAPIAPEAPQMMGHQYPLSGESPLQKISVL